MTIQDIEEALDRKDLIGIEAAFRLLVEWPRAATIEDADDPAELARLLDRVTAALEADRRQMPEPLVDSILVAAHDGTWLRDDRSYAAGARAVAAKGLEWVSLFQARLGLPKDFEPDIPSW